LYRENKSQDVIPNCIDFRRWNIPNKTLNSNDSCVTKTQNSNGNCVTIGWIGAGNHSEDLRIMQEVIPVIIRKYPNVKFKFVYGAPDYIRKMGKRVECTKKWLDIFKYPEFMASQGIDIGMAPVLINRFNMAKSNLRFLEYSALKIPCVATDICTYNNDIKNGVNGFVAKTAEDWINNLSVLIENKTLRADIGEKAFKYVYKNYNLDDVAVQYIRAFKKYEQRLRKIRKENKEGITNEQV